MQICIDPGEFFRDEVEKPFVAFLSARCDCGFTRFMKLLLHNECWIEVFFEAILFCDGLGIFLVGCHPGSRGPDRSGCSLNLWAFRSAKDH